MSKKPRRIASAIRSLLPNAGWDAVKQIAKWAYDNLALFIVIMGAIGTGLTSIINRLRGLPSDALGLLAIFGVVVVVALISYVVGRVREKRETGASADASDPQPEGGEKRVSTVPLARQPDIHEDCLRQIRNLESQVRRLQEHDQTQGIQISARDTQIEQLEAQLDQLKTCPYELVHRIADQEAKVIRDFVSVSRVGVWRHKLDDPVPTIKWGFMIKNDSIFPISLIEVRNNLLFENTQLAERRFVDNNEIQELPQWRGGWMIFEQRLSPIEAQHIKSTPNGKFHFERLIITVGNPKNFPIIEPQQLDIEKDLETTLDKITYKETEGMKRLKDEIASLREQKEELEALAQKRGLTFEIDAKRTRVQYRGYSNSGNTTVIGALVRLRCSKDVDSKLAVRQFLAQLRSEGTGAAFADGILVRAYVDNEAKDSVNTEAGWIIDEPLTEYRVYDFMFEITTYAIPGLSRQDFFRVTMDTVGQEQQHIDFFVGSWTDARNSESSITLRDRV